MSDALLDTSVLIASGERAWSGLPPSAAISVVTLGELHAGVRLARARRVEAVRQRRLAAVRAASVALPLDEPVAERYGELLALARTERPTARVSDLLIIATAAATKRELYTLDVAQSRLAQAAGVPATTL